MFFSTPIFTALFLNKSYKGTYYFGEPIIDETEKRKEILLFLEKNKSQQYDYNDLMRAVKEDNFTTILGIMTVLWRKGQVQVETKNSIKYFSYKERS